VPEPATWWTDVGARCAGSVYEARKEPPSGQLGSLSVWGASEGCRKEEAPSFNCSLSSHGSSVASWLSANWLPSFGWSRCFPAEKTTRMDEQLALFSFLSSFSLAKVQPFEAPPRTWSQFPIGDAQLCWPVGCFAQQFHQPKWATI